VKNTSLINSSKITLVTEAQSFDDYMKSFEGKPHVYGLESNWGGGYTKFVKASSRAEAIEKIGKGAHGSLKVFSDSAAKDLLKRYAEALIVAKKDYENLKKVM
jgi:hypothetical protein